nr:conserved hypothetical protein [Albugo laibachii Nc14]|eukprot:CCA23939.1 conserved hypothetical protein [Albugo laibachii Nc14]
MSTRRNVTGVSADDGIRRHESACCKSERFYRCRTTALHSLSPYNYNFTITLALDLFQLQLYIHSCARFPSKSTVHSLSLVFPFNFNLTNIPIRLFPLLDIHPHSFSTTQHSRVLSNRKEQTKSKGDMEVRAWTNIPTQGDAFTSRTGHTVVAHGRCVYLFGGTDCTGRQQDFYRFDIDTNQWTKLVSQGSVPSRRSGASGVVHRDRMYLFGGYEGRNGSYFQDLYYYDFETQIWDQVKCSNPNVCPQERTDHSMVVYEDSLYLFGGCDKSTRFDDLWRFDLSQKRWEQVTMDGDIPVPCFGHTAIVHESSHRLIVFGGWDGHNTLDTLYEFNFYTRHWTLLESTESTPSHRYRHSVVVYDDEMYVFGGVDKSQVRFNDLQQFNLVTNTWSEVCTTGNLPCSRTFHRSVLVDSQMYLLGGYDGTHRLHDLHSIELGTSSARNPHSMLIVHLGALSPLSLVDLCASFIRKNHSTMPLSTPLSALPSDLLCQIVFKRDAIGILRGKCTQCPGGRCDIYRYPRRKMSIGSHKTTNLNVECFCGHSNFFHEHVSIYELANGGIDTKSANQHVSNVINDVYTPTMRLLRNAFCKRISDPTRSSRPSRKSTIPHDTQ